MSIRKPSVAGQFYPKNQNELSFMLESFFKTLKNTHYNSNRHIAALLVPHAGYVYSGVQAAKAYSAVRSKNYKLVCIISPSHRVYFNSISVSPHDAYQTPLGDIVIDKKATEIALSCSGIEKTMQGHGNEHALEVQLPFVQYVLGNIPMLPMVMGDQSMLAIENLSVCISNLYAEYHKDILFIASSDLSHFHHAIEAKSMDEKFIELLQKADWKSLYELLYYEEIEACGAGPILALLKGLELQEADIEVLGYSHSGQISCDNSSVVGYTSALLMKD
jgi:hypothetical protein